MKLLQIIIPAYNAERFIKDTLDALQAQTFMDWTCVIVDDGSTDNTLSIAQECTQNDARFSVYTQPNKGVSAARNFGMFQITEDAIWTIFLDADDIYEKDALAILLFTTARLWCPALGTPLRRIDENSQWLDGYDTQVAEEPIRAMDPHIEEYPLERFKVTPGVIGTPGSWIFRSDWVRMLEGYDETMSAAEDSDFLMRSCMRSPLIVMYTNVIRYRRYPGQTSQRLDVVQKGADRMTEKHGPWGTPGETS